MSIQKLENSVQKYHWGDKFSIPNLLGLENSSDETFAELWMGVHHRGPSKIKSSGKTLASWLDEDSENRLGKRLSTLFNGLSYLFKVLAVESPLSIQVHPSIAIAEAGFNREDKQKISISDSKRTFKDKNHKPEMVVAITPYWAMKGFRPLDEIRKNLKILNFKPLIEITESDNNANKILKELLSYVLQMDNNNRKQMIESVKNVLLSNPDGEHWDWIERLLKFYPEDPSIISPLYLNLIKLQPGEALYLNDQEIHAYLHGVSIEIMANSDNVVRGGLTQKYIDIDQLLKITNFQPSDVNIIKPDNNSIFRYPADIEDFSLRRVINDCNVENHSVSILIVMDGSFTVQEGNSSLELSKGDSVAISNDTKSYQLLGNGLVFIAESGY